jgi:phenylacetate-CoA ligase
MLVRIETTGPTGGDCTRYEALLRQRLGVEIGVRLAAPGELAALTQIEVRQKPIRLIDRRRG